MKLPPMPLLSQRDFIDSDQFCNSSTVQGCVQDYCACTHVLRVNLDSVVEIVLVDEGLSIILYFYIICARDAIFKSKYCLISNRILLFLRFRLRRESSVSSSWLSISRDRNGKSR